ncbi:MAG: hypothetical protein AVDCRST_MAG45-1687, partial [uncultured Solirubrobacterales bacterium]
DALLHRRRSARRLGRRGRLPGDQVRPLPGRQGGRARARHDLDTARGGHRRLGDHPRGRRGAGRWRRHGRGRGRRRL